MTQTGSRRWRKNLSYILLIGGFVATVASMAMAIYYQIYETLLPVLPYLGVFYLFAFILYKATTGKELISSNRLALVIEIGLLVLGIISIVGQAIMALSSNDPNKALLNLGTLIIVGAYGQWVYKKHQKILLA
jgi:hypothetical protein